jgi:hypothetical protein
MNNPLFDQFSVCGVYHLTTAAYFSTMVLKQRFTAKNDAFLDRFEAS